MRDAFDDIGFHSWSLTLLQRCNDSVIHSKIQRSIAQLFNKMWFQGTIREVLYSPTALDDHDMQYLQMLYSVRPSSTQPGVDVFGFTTLLSVQYETTHSTTTCSHFYSYILMKSRVIWKSAESQSNICYFLILKESRTPQTSTY